MTLAITTYTTYDSVRAVLGVDATELPDTVLVLDMYAAALERALRLCTPTSHSVGGDGTLLARATDLLAKEELETLTADEEYYLSQIKIFAAQIVAREMLPGLSALLRRTESDGKASASRFSSEATFRDIVTRVIDSCSATLSILVNNGTTPTGTVSQFLHVVGPETDVVEEGL